MTDTNQGIPGTPNTTLVDRDGNVTPPWWAFFVNLYQRTGGPSGAISTVLDGITKTAGSILYRGSAGWVGLPPAADGKVLQMGAQFPTWGQLQANNFAPQAHNEFLVGPATGTEAIPTFRHLETADLNTIAGQIPGTGVNGDADPGNVGEFISSSVPIGSAIALTSGAAANITSIDLTAGDWDLWASVAFDALPSTSANGWINSASATDPGAPNGGAYAAVGNQSQAFPLGSLRVSISVTTTWRLSVLATFAGTLNGYGFLGARRRR